MSSCNGIGVADVSVESDVPSKKRRLRGLRYRPGAILVLKKSIQKSLLGLILRITLN